MSLLPYAAARPFLFGMDPEAAHDLTLSAIAKLQHSPLTCLYSEPRVHDRVHSRNRHRTLGDIRREDHFSSRRFPKGAVLLLA